MVNVSQLNTSSSMCMRVRTFTDVIGQVKASVYTYLTYILDIQCYVPTRAVIIMRWDVAGALASPNGIRVNSNNSALATFNVSKLRIYKVLRASNTRSITKSTYLCK
jgi:hypothetical protein